MSWPVCRPASGCILDVLACASSNPGRESPGRAADTWSLAGQRSGRGRATPSPEARTSWPKARIVRSWSELSAARAVRHQDGDARRGDGNAKPRVCPLGSSGRRAQVVRLAHQDIATAAPILGAARPDIATTHPDIATAEPILGSVRSGHRDGARRSCVWHTKTSRRQHQSSGRRSPTSRRRFQPRRRQRATSGRHGQTRRRQRQTSGRMIAPCEDS
jgi:hypothetical protein